MALRVATLISINILFKLGIKKVQDSKNLGLH